MENVKLKQTENLSFCKEVVEGQKCNECENGEYLDEEGNCMKTNKCKKRGALGNCKECSSGYHLSSFGNVSQKQKIVILELKVKEYAIDVNQDIT